LGTTGNDVPIPFTAGFDPSLARERDLEQAKALLKAAGAEALSFTVTTSNGFAGMVESATLLQQQLKDAGIKVNLDQVDQSQYWVNFLRYPFGQGVWWGYEALAPFYLAALTTTSPYRETRFGTEATDQLIYDAVGELDKAKSQDKWNAIEQQQFEEGGYVIPATFPFVDAMAHNVVVQTSTLGFINNYRLGDAYFTS
jgi:peptide/nickel transport system substrate-binding protein